MMVMMSDVTRVMIVLKIVVLAGLHPAAGRWRHARGGGVTRMADVMEETTVNEVRQLRGARAGVTETTVSHAAKDVKTNGAVTNVSFTGAVVNTISGRLLADQAAPVQRR